MHQYEKKLGRGSLSPLSKLVWSPFKEIFVEDRTNLRKFATLAGALKSYERLQTKALKCTNTKKKLGEGLIEPSLQTSLVTFQGNFRWGPYKQKKSCIILYNYRLLQVKTNFRKLLLKDFSNLQQSSNTIFFPTIDACDVCRKYI